LNLNGQTTIQSFFGSFISILNFSLLISNAVIRFEVLHKKRDTLVSSVVVPEWIDSSTKFNFGQNECQIAFAVEYYLTRRGSDDPDYVEWYVRLN
jgi:hypothetical protein